MSEQQTPAPFGGAQPGDIIRLGEYPLAEFLRVVKVTAHNYDGEYPIRGCLRALRAVDEPRDDPEEVFIYQDCDDPCIKVVGKWTADDEQWEGE